MAYTKAMQLEEIKGVGPALGHKLAGLNLHTVQDVLHYFPRKYEDYSHIESIYQIKPGIVTIKAVIKQARGRYVRRGLHITEGIASDETGSVRLVWFNQPYRAGAFKSGETYFISGLFELSHQRMAIMNPSCELVSSFPVNTARIRPVYRESGGVTSLQIRKIIQQGLRAVRRRPEG